MVSVDSDSIGTNHPFTGQLSQQINQSFVWSRFLTSQLVLSPINPLYLKTLPGLNTIPFSDAGGQYDLTFAGNRGFHLK